MTAWSALRQTVVSFSQPAMFRPLVLIVVAVALLISACTSVEVKPEAGASEQLARPTRVPRLQFRSHTD